MILQNKKQNRMLSSIRSSIERQVSLDQEEDLNPKVSLQDMESLALSASPLAGKASKLIRTKLSQNAKLLLSIKPIVQSQIHN